VVVGEAATSLDRHATVGVAVAIIIARFVGVVIVRLWSRRRPR
jgi:hypothetical protein